jgi:putative sterol carrier protein
VAKVDPTSRFFTGLAHGSQRLANVTATIRVDLDRGDTTEHWLVDLENGCISVSGSNASADATVHADKETFDQLAQGEANPFASLLRGLVHAEGDTELIVLFQGLFPSPHKARRNGQIDQGEEPGHER